MKVVICGGGRVGVSIAQYLGDEYTISVIDNNAAVLAEVSAQLDVQTVLGNAANPDVLRRAGIEKANIFVAVTATDEVNIVASQIVDTLFQVPLKIARLRHLHDLEQPLNQKYKDRHLPIDVIIAPEEETTKEIMHHLRAPFAASSFSVFKNRLYVLGLLIEIDSPLLPYPLKHLEKILGPIDASLIAIDRKGFTFIPQEHDAFEAGDLAYFTIPTERIALLAEAAGYTSTRIERVLIFGGDRMGLFLASEIERTYPHISCILIEPQNTRARHLITQLNNTIVMQGDPLEPHLLREAGVQFADSVIAISGNDTANILGALLAKRYGAKNAVSLISRQNYIPLMHFLQIDKLLNPAFLAVSLILTHVRRDYAISLRKLGDKALDNIIELRIQPGVPAIGTTLAMINHPKELWICSVMRDDKIITGFPSLTLEEGDIVLALSAQSQHERVRSFFEPPPAPLSPEPATPLS